DAAPADEGLETTGLIEAKPGGGQPEEPWMAQEQTEVEPAEEAADGRARPSALHLGLRGLDEPTVGHARRADGLTRAAVEAEREMARHAIRERDPPLRERLDEKDAPTRRVHLRAQLGERGTGREAESAVDTLVDALDGEPVERERPRARNGRLLDRVRHPSP